MARVTATTIQEAVRRLIGRGALVFLPGVTPQDTGPDPRETGIGRVVDLTGPIAARGGVLGGAPKEEPPKRDDESAYQQVIVDGAALPVVGGAPADQQPPAQDASGEDNAAKPDDDAGPQAALTQ